MVPTKGYCSGNACAPWSLTKRAQAMVRPHPTPHRSAGWPWGSIFVYGISWLTGTDSFRRNPLGAVEPIPNDREVQYDEEGFRHGRIRPLTPPRLSPCIGDSAAGGQPAPRTHRRAPLDRPDPGGHRHIQWCSRASHDVAPLGFRPAFADRAARSPSVRHGARAAGEPARPGGWHTVALGGGHGGSVLGDCRPLGGDRGSPPA